jgi:hypothetical protein
MALSKRYLSALAINLDKEIDRLYGLPLDRFTQARDTRIKELRSGGEREAADQLKKARKPTAAAWVANQLARNERMNVRALLTAGEQLREGQAELMRGGKADELRRAEESERRALTALLDAGRSLADGDATLRKLESTLRAAAVDPDARELLERGRLTKELSPSGFGLAGMESPIRPRSGESASWTKPAPLFRRHRNVPKRPIGRRRKREKTSSKPRNRCGASSVRTSEHVEREGDELGEGNVWSRLLLGRRGGVPPDPRRRCDACGLHRRKRREPDLRARVLPHDGPCGGG